MGLRRSWAAMPSSSFFCSLEPLPQLGVALRELALQVDELVVDAGLLGPQLRRGRRRGRTHHRETLERFAERRRLFVADGEQLLVEPVTVFLGGRGGHHDQPAFRLGGGEVERHHGALVHHIHLPVEGGLLARGGLEEMSPLALARGLEDPLERRSGRQTSAQAEAVAQNGAHDALCVSKKRDARRLSDGHALLTSTSWWATATADNASLALPSAPSFFQSSGSRANG